ncbi:MAG: HlyD family efflux transporter periplasmic adaptor subunit [Bacteroidetes bacterium]|nr:HlyD family efflux transporter periplasmic adaptor subunit [Bacteroidota bacterium]
MHSIKKLLRFLKPLYPQVRVIYILAILQGVFYLAVPLGIQAVVTYTMAGQMSASLVLLCILTILAVIFMGLFQMWKMRANETLQQHILARIGVGFSQKLSSLGQDHQRASQADNHVNYFFDTLTLQKGLSKILMELSYALISIFFGLILLSLYNTVFILFTLVTALTFFIIIRVTGRRAMDTSLSESKEKYKFVDKLHHLFSAAQDRQQIGDGATSAADASLMKYIRYKSLHFQILDLQYRSIFIFKIVFTALLLFLGIWLVQQGYINIGQFVASEILVILIINGVEKLITSLDTVYDVLTAIEKLDQALGHDGMLNYLLNAPDPNIGKEVYDSVYQYRYTRITRILFYAMMAVGFLTLLMPWNQTVSGTGKVTTLNPSDKPQTIPSRIPGRIEKWYVREGEVLRKGDTIAQISEIKEDYFDPHFVGRTESQLRSKEAAISSYEQKVNAIDQQLDALNNARSLKLDQAQNKLLQAYNKLKSDSIEYHALMQNNDISDNQFKRYEELLSQGVISRTDFESRKAKLQESQAKTISAENKWINSKNEITNLLIEINAIRQDYNEKMTKAESEKFSALSNMYDAEASLTKMQGQLSGYTVRSGYYYVTAPQDGYVTQTFVQGVGDIVKEGMPLISFVPQTPDLSVELYIDPMDLALVQKNMRVQITFDGWPAFVFSGWPGMSVGTYTGRVVAIDRAISANGKFRLLVARADQQWPHVLSVGTGAKGFALLNKVPLAYEIWRKVNGFPPDFYKPTTTTNDDKKKK